MEHSLVRFIIILILFQCSQGTVHHFNPKRSLRRSRNSDFRADFIYHFEDESIFLRNDDNNAVDKLSQLLRTRRQAAGGSPVSYQSDLIMDDRQYALTMYSGEGSKVIYLLTFDVASLGIVSSSTLYRSIDYGQTFLNQSDKLPSGSILDYTIYRFPNDSTVIFVDASGSMIYVTTDEGETFTVRSVPVDPKTMKMHPTMLGWILGHDPYQGVLMSSENFGLSWATVAWNVHPLTNYYRYESGYLLTDYNWGEPGIDWDTSNPSLSDVTKVYYSVIDPDITSGNDRIVHVAYKDLGYVRKVFDPKLGYVYSFLVDGGYIYADRQISDDYYYGDFELHVSYMRKPFNLARVPTYFSHYSYFVGSHRGSQSLIIVDHDTHFNLYLSDETGTYYSLSLEDLVVQIYDLSADFFAIDLEIINSINGTMMANQYTFVNGRRRNQTLITFDNGASWNGITAPVGSSSNCTQSTCSLHFHMDTSREYRRIGVYSRDSAPGIIVAHGNVGSYLTDTGSVYITRDGGLSWEQTLDYTWHVEIIDHGGLLVAAKDNHQDYSMTIKYSCNEGMSWSDFDFISSSIVVWGVITEPGETTTQVLLFGTRSKEMRSDWIVVHVNFTSIFSHTCEASDYNQWTVSDGRIGDQQCLLGETRIIERRKPSVCCWNSRQYERLISATPCQCTAADFECEYGYERDYNSGSCVLNRQYGPKLDCLTGYRKIPGDKCYGGVSSQYLPPDSCTVEAYFDGSSGRNDDDNDNSSNDDNDNSSNDDNSNTAVAVSVSVVVVMITLATITLILLGVVFYFRKQNKRLTSTTPMTDPTVAQNVYQEPAVLAKISDQEILIGDTLDYNKLVEEKSEL